jgi:hypothetical protein
MYGFIRSTRLHFLSLLIAALLVSMVLPSTTEANNYFNQAQWGVNSSWDQAGLYYVYISPQPPSDNTYGTFTTGWLGLYLHACDNPGSVCCNNPGCALFSQVGTQSDPNIGGIFWFVYAEPGVTCLSGNPSPDGLECRGDSGIYVDYSVYNGVSLTHNVSGQNWLAAVQNYSGQGGYVAQIGYDTPRIYAAFVAQEEGYTSTSDPLIDMRYYFYHPAYGVGNPWPYSSGNDNFFSSFGLRSPGSDPYPPAPYGPCVYGGVQNVNGDPRLWYAGIGGTQCSWVFDH